MQIQLSPYFSAVRGGSGNGIGSIVRDAYAIKWLVNGPETKKIHVPAINVNRADKLIPSGYSGYATEIDSKGYKYTFDRVDAKKDQYVIGVNFPTSGFLATYLIEGGNFTGGTILLPTPSKKVPSFGIAQDFLNHCDGLKITQYHI